MQEPPNGFNLSCSVLRDYFFCPLLWAICLCVDTLATLCVRRHCDPCVCVTTPLLGVSLRVRRGLAVPVRASILRVFCAFFATLAFRRVLQIMHTRNKTDGFYVQKFHNNDNDRHQSSLMLVL